MLLTNLRCETAGGSSPRFKPAEEKMQLTPTGGNAVAVVHKCSSWTVKGGNWGETNNKTRKNYYQKSFCDVTMTPLLSEQPELCCADWKVSLQAVNKGLTCASSSFLIPIEKSSPRR